MQIRIIKREHFTGAKPVARYLVAQYKKTFLSGWKDIEYFYKSDFEDMPGVWTSVCTDVAAAHMAINQFKAGVNVTESLVYEE